MPYHPDAAWKPIGVGSPKKGDGSRGYVRSLEWYLVRHPRRGLSWREIVKRLVGANSPLFLERLPISPAHRIRNTCQHIPLAIHDCDRCADYKSFGCPHCPPWDRKPVVNLSS